MSSYMLAQIELRNDRLFLRIISEKRTLNDDKISNNSSVKNSITPITALPFVTNPELPNSAP